MKAVILIPARLDSSRLEKKMLASRKICGIRDVLVCVVSFFSPGVFAFVEMSGIYPSESS